MNYIVWAIPVFLLFMGIELLAAKVEGKEVYRLNDSINDLSCGIIEQVILAFVKTFLFGLYVLIYEVSIANNINLFHVEPSIWSWIVLFIAVDFLYYWAHRFSHTTAIGWAGHAVHHQSEEFNLAVALRQGTFQPFFTFVFFLPLAWIGFAPAMYLVVKATNTLYQFWIHTRLVRRMGFLEWFMNTPSHHRVHHGKNDQYIDKNYAGVFIIWDRIFGSFEEEDVAPLYGVVTPLNSWNPIWANVGYLWHLAKLSLRSPFFFDKFKVWFMPPGWNPRGVEEEETEKIPLCQKYDPELSLAVKLYTALQFIVILTATIYLLYYFSQLHQEKYVIATFIVVSLVSLGGILDKKRWAPYLEVMRFALFIFVIQF